MIEKIGGRDRVRTCDPLLAKQVLSQLSYTPNDVPFHSKLDAISGATRNRLNCARAMMTSWRKGLSV